MNDSCEESDATGSTGEGARVSLVTGCGVVPFRFEWWCGVVWSEVVCLCVNHGEEKRCSGPLSVRAVCVQCESN
jgi:hypothetical protein